MSGPPVQAIDCWLHPPTGMANSRPEYLVRVAREYFHREQEMFTETPLEVLLQQMDAAGVERAILTIDGGNPAPYHAIAQAFPQRFVVGRRDSAAKVTEPPCQPSPHPPRLAGAFG